ncbi:MAG: low molecular weight protein arginine phosphatase [Lachnospiraceae bacterium]|nr:low molecular weight protein arginine phosphatase [Lachnospiraceae bacterium]
MEKYQKILFLCTGNTCRSPMAETILRNLMPEQEVMSRGLVVLFPEPVNPKAENVLSNHNLHLNNHVTRGLRAMDLEEGTLVLTMTEAQRERVRKDFGMSEHLYTLKEFVGEYGDVTDPYGGTLMDYEDCYVELTRLIKKLVYKLAEE